MKIIRYSSFKSVINMYNTTFMVARNYCQQILPKMKKGRGIILNMNAQSVIKIVSLSGLAVKIKLPQCPNKTIALDEGEKYYGCPFKPPKGAFIYIPAFPLT